MTRRPLETWVLVVLDAALGAGVLWLALRYGEHRDVLVHFFVYAGVVFAFKARSAVARIPQLVRQARRPAVSVGGPPLLRILRLLVGYDNWSRTERFGLATIATIVVLLFGWDDGGPLAAALFLAVAAVNAVLVVVATAALLSGSDPGQTPRAEKRLVCRGFSRGQVRRPPRGVRPGSDAGQTRPEALRDEHAD